MPDNVHIYARYHLQMWLAELCNPNATSQMTLIHENYLRRMNLADRQALGKAGRTAEERAARAEEKTEKAIQEEIAAWLRIHYITFNRSRMDRKATGTVGWPDFDFPYCGLPVFLEVKTLTGRLTSEQEAVHAGLRRQGGMVGVVHNLPEAIEYLRKIEQL